MHNNFFTKMLVVFFLLTCCMVSWGSTVHLLCPNGSALGSGDGVFSAQAATPHDLTYQNINNAGDITLPSEWNGQKINVFTRGFAYQYCNGECRETECYEDECTCIDGAHLGANNFTLTDNMTIVLNR